MNDKPVLKRARCCGACIGFDEGKWMDEDGYTFCSTVKQDVREIDYCDKWSPYNVPAAPMKDVYGPGEY